MIPVVLSISVEDMAGRQGILTDIKTHQALQVYGVGISQGMLKDEIHQSPLWSEEGYLKEKLSYYKEILCPTVIKYSFLENMPYWEEILVQLARYPQIPIVLDMGYTRWESMEEGKLEKIRMLLRDSHSLLILDFKQLGYILGEKPNQEEVLAELVSERLGVNVLVRDAKIKESQGHFLIQKSGTWFWVASSLSLESIYGAKDTLSAGIAAYIARGRALKKSIVDAVHFIENVKENIMYFQKDMPMMIPSKLKIIERICDMKKLLFIVNPTSGKGLVKSECLDIVDIFTKAGYITTTYPTQSRGDASRCIKDIGHLYDVIVCSGGDGTLDEVITGMMEVEMNDTPLGYLPAGSTNDFAKTLNLPTDLVKASKLISRAKQFRCDIGEFMDTYFVYVAAFGIFADVSYKTDQGLKNALGHMAYVLEGFKSLTNVKSHELIVVGDNQTYEGTFIFGMISNSTSVGGFEGIMGDNVELSDGLFEVTLVKYPSHILELNQIITSLNNPDLDNDMVISFKAKQIQIISKDGSEIPWSLDGEYGGIYSQVHIQNHQRAIPFLIDQENEI